MEAGKQNYDKRQQNFDTRTLALLNRLASRWQNMPTSAARPDSAKVDSGWER